ncbi:MAG: Flp pilus assembly protein CpaB [Pseudomonadota bacterium]
MRLVFGLVLLLGLGLAGTAVYMANQVFAANEAELMSVQERARQELQNSLTEVIVSTQAVRYGDQLSKQDVRKVRWPRDGIPQGAFTDMAVLFPEGEPPRTVLRAMEAGEAIMEIKVTEPGRDAGVGSKLAAGMRAFALRVDVASGVSGFIRPGDRVDIYWTGSNTEDAGGTREFTKLILSAMKIIAIDQSADQDRNAPTVARTVTVEATPVQVATLAQAQATGRLQLSLVGAADDGTLDGEIAVTQEIIVGEEEEVVRREERRCTVRNRRGGEIVEVEIECPDATN